MKFNKLPKDFFQRRADVVAKELLGKILVRKINGKKIRAKIVETEAYFGEEDPASRACKNGDLKETMQMKPGIILVYGVHNNWLINFVTDREKEASAVLIRALQPLNFNNNCSGPGLLTKSMKINKDFHKKDLINNKKLWVEESDSNNRNFGIIETSRIGIKKDLPQKLRFYIKDNKHVSRK